MVTIVATLLAAVALAASAFSVFTTSYRARRVLAAYETDDQLFSSNYMRTGDVLVDFAKLMATVYVDEAPSAQQPKTATVTVCNYTQLHPEAAYGGAILYDIEVTLYDSARESVITTDAGVKINGNALSNGRWSRSGVELSNVSATGQYLPISHEYVVSFEDPAVLDNRYYLEIKATPNLGIMKPISVWFNVMRTPQVHQSRWMLQREENAYNATDYYGYNFIYSGSGSGWTTLSWDNTKVRLSDVSKLELKDDNGYVVTADVNPVRFYVSDEKPSYTLQFYTVGNSVSDWSDISFLSEAGTAVVTAVFTPDDE